MKITRAEITSAISAFRTDAGHAPVDAAASAAFAPTTEAGALGALAQLAVAEPFYRPGLVARLQRQIDRGEYHVPSADIVEKMLGRVAVDG